MKTLVLAAHPDDETLGAGATIAKFASQGELIKVVSFTDGAGARGSTHVGRQSSLDLAAKILGIQCIETHNFPDNRMDTVPLLDVIKVIEKNIEEWKPQRILTHSRSCLNIDHKKVFEATLVATRGSHIKVMSYEVPSSTEWNHGAPFVPNCFVDVTGFESKKIAALRIAYSEELRSGNHPRSLELILQQMRVNGSVCCVAYAERFEIVKEVM